MRARKFDEVEKSCGEFFGSIFRLPKPSNNDAHECVMIRGCPTVNGEWELMICSLQLLVSGLIIISVRTDLQFRG